MLDVVLYGHDRRGRLDLQERAFRSLRGLAHFFSSREAIPWEWAEVTRTGPDGRPCVVRYSADALRATIEASNPVPGAN